MPASKNKMGMTLIEIMIAMFVFSVGILGVLKLVISTISNQDRLNLKNTANMIAKQNMELIFHQRNSNRISYQVWDCVEENEKGECITRLGDFVDKGENSDDIIIPSFDENLGYKFFFTGKSQNFQTQRKNTRFDVFSGGNPKTQSDSFLKVYKYCKDNCGKKSYFGSFVKVDKIKNLPREDLLSGNIYKITSKCLFLKGGVTGEVFLESFIANLDE